MKICDACGEEFPFRIKVGDKWRNLKNRRYCTNCSPFGLHNTKPIGRDADPRRPDGVCDLCAKPVGGKRTRCGYCFVKIRRCRMKLAAVAMFGGACLSCGFDEDPYDMEFHHIDGDKDFAVSEKQNISWDRIKAELAKCTMLCSRCHRKEHRDRDRPELWRAVLDYSGELDLSMFLRFRPAT